MLRWRNEGWARGTARRGGVFCEGVQTLQRKLLVSREVPLSWHLSQHISPVEGSGVNVMSRSDLALQEQRRFIVNVSFAGLRGFFFNLSKTERQAQIHSANLSELQERLFWQEQNNLAVLFVGLWSVEILKEQLQRRKQCFKITFFFCPIERFVCKGLQDWVFLVFVSCN